MAPGLLSPVPLSSRPARIHHSARHGVGWKCGVNYQYRKLVSIALAAGIQQGTVEWRFAHLAKRKEMEDKKESTAAPVSSGEAPLAVIKPSAKSVKKEKLAPKNKSRLPRRQKKAQQKAAGRL
jgi:hypothetical protein